MLLILFDLMYKSYSQDQNILFPCRDKLSPVFKHGFLRSEENVYLAILYTQKVYQKMFPKKHFFLFLMADVMPYVRLMLCLG